jgi:hypothetical protein
MRPAFPFLMLSSCHAELRRQTRAPDGIETETSGAHLDKSRRWLQCVWSDESRNYVWIRFWNAGHSCLS